MFSEKEIIIFILIVDIKYCDGFDHSDSIHGYLDYFCTRLSSR